MKAAFRNESGFHLFYPENTLFYHLHRPTACTVARILADRIAVAARPTGTRVFSLQIKLLSLVPNGNGSHTIFDLFNSTFG